MWLQYVIRWNKDLISKMKNITFQVHVNKKTSQSAHENAFKKTYEYQLHQWLMMTWILVRTKTTRKNTMCWPVAQFPNSICRNAKWMGLCLCSDINGRKQLKQKKHNKSYSELNGSSDRGPRGQALSNAQPQSCWIAFPAGCSASMTYNNPWSTQDRGYYRAFHCIRNKSIRLWLGSPWTVFCFPGMWSALHVMKQ